MKTATQTAPEKEAGISVSIRELQKSLDVLNHLFSLRAKPNVVWRLKAVLRNINPIFQDFEKRRVELCEKYGTLNPDTQVYDMTDENEVLYKQDIETIGDEIKSIPVAPLKLTEVNFADLSAMELLALDWLIIEK